MKIKRNKLIIMERKVITKDKLLKKIVYAITNPIKTKNKRQLILLQIDINLIR